MDAAIAVKPRMYVALGDQQSLKIPMPAIPRALKGRMRVLLRLITVALSALGMCMFIQALSGG